MHLIERIDLMEGAQPGEPSRFTGPAEQRLIHEAAGHPGVRVLMVRFHRGTRTNWHRHSAGQVLHVVEGQGLVQSWGEEVRRIGAGDVITAEPEEKHWHGAGPDQSMTHLAVSAGSVDWLEPPP